jgi:hypothetical protein
MDIKQQLAECIASESVFEPRIPGITKLCRDALAEIERREQSHAKTVSAVRQVEALARITFCAAIVINLSLREPGWCNYLAALCNAVMWVLFELRV